MNFKKFTILHNRLMTLLEEQEELILTQTPQVCDWLKQEQLTKKYPELEECVTTNRMAVLSTISELINLSANGVTFEQTLSIFNQQ